jgi:hypothetical protein
LGVVQGFVQQQQAGDGLIKFTASPPALLLAMSGEFFSINPAGPDGVKLVA